MPRSLLNKNQKVLTENLLLITVIMLGVISLSFYFVSCSLSRPLEEMTKTVKRIQAGETQLRMENLKEDEVGELGQSFNNMLDQIEGLIAKEYENKLLLNRAEYQALQAQINPHFLYNTLDTMSSIAEIQNCSQVSALCQSLAGIFRYSLNMKEPFSTVAQEIVHLKNYIYVMNVRMQNQVQYEFEIDDVTLMDTLPRISIQPLVENAVNHGLRNRKGEKKVYISCLMLRSFGRENAFLRAGQEKSAQQGNIAGRISEAQIKEIQGCLKARSLPGLKKLLFEEVGLAHCEKEKWSYLEVRQTVQRFVNYLMEQYAKKLGAAAMLDAQSMLEMADKTAEMLDVKPLCELLTEIMEYFLNASQPQSTDSIKDGIRQAVAYVEEHFQENLTLSSLAEQFHVESSYFSRMFRKQTGENLMLFICHKRMEKAVEYMRDPERNLTEIAFMVGYDDYTYFNKVFRKTMGKSPREYRNSIMEDGV